MTYDLDTGSGPAAPGPVQLRELMDAGDPAALDELLTRHPELARSPLPWGPVDRLGNETSVDAKPHMSDPLHYISDAVFHRRFRGQDAAAVARRLLAAGAWVNGSEGRESPLHGAASLGQVEVARVLLDAGADLEARAHYPGISHGTPLDFAVEFGMAKVADLLVERGAWRGTLRLVAGTAASPDDVTALVRLWDSRAPDDDEVLDAFRCSVVGERLVVLPVFVDRGVDPQSVIRDATALHWAAWEGKARSVEWLLAHGADATRRDPHHDSTAAGWGLYRSEGLGAGWGHARAVALLALAELLARRERASGAE